MNLADTTYGYSLVAVLQDGVSGHLTYNMIPISIVLRLFAPSTSASRQIH
ncbi:hypothetical protein Poly30_03590 [Planctomycetes bacterium Poly30]|uniref:Uncharacterized protein n=1 Tax=Saltatorellus ferox TaxID=2528018 RepID=A0A518EL91_9BACT|nr:hypothetical protein Poly30_03590 [Planctomycetes bacterium Poly30]